MFFVGAGIYYYSKRLCSVFLHIFLSIVGTFSISWYYFAYSIF